MFLFRYGVIHGDPHLGNYTIMNNANLNLLDFGVSEFLNQNL